MFDRAAILTAFEQIGGADRALEMARDYALDRMAFGRPIGSFQAVKHMLADMYVSATLARSNGYYGAWALSTDAAELPEAAATARVSATQAFQHCARNNIQVHGGMGFTWAFDCHLYYRRSNLLALGLGSQSHWEDQLIARLRAKNAAYRGPAPWISTTRPKRPLSGLRRAPGSTPTRPGACTKPSPKPVSASSRRVSTCWPKAGPGRSRRQRRAGPACTGRDGIWRARRQADVERVIWQQEEGVYATLSGALGIGHGVCAALDDDGLRLRKLKRLYIAAGRGRRDLVPAVFRTGRGVRLGRASHPRRTGAGRLR